MGHRFELKPLGQGTHFWDCPEICFLVWLKVDIMAAEQKWMFKGK